MRERYEVREALEYQAARVFSRAARRGDRAGLTEAGEQVDALYDNYLARGKRDPGFLYIVQETHARFHLRIAEGCGCRGICVPLEASQALTLGQLFDIAARQLALPPRCHSDLVESLCGGDEEEADQAMRTRIRHGFARIVSCITPEITAGVEGSGRLNGHLAH